MDDAADVAAVALAYPRALPVAAQVVALARKLGVKPAWIANVIDFESGHTWNPAAVNPNSGATGLVQFTPRTAPELGTTTQALARMSAPDQFAYVERYFLLPRIPKPLRSQLDVFMAVFYPYAIGKDPHSYVFGSENGPTYVAKLQAGNPGIKVPSDYQAMALRYAKMAP